MRNLRTYASDDFLSSELPGEQTAHEHDTETLVLNAAKRGVLRATADAKVR
jgi:hypothetical protein